MRYLFVLLVLLSVSIACNKKEEKDHTKEMCTKKCKDTPLIPLFLDADFQSAEIDTILLKVYEGDSNFSNLITETLITYSDSFRRYIYNTQDTGINPGRMNLYPGYCYEIGVPGSGNTYRIWSIKGTEKTVYERCVARLVCEEPVTDFKISGGAYELQSASHPYNGHAGYYLVFK